MNQHDAKYLPIINEFREILGIKPTTKINIVDLGKIIANMLILAKPVSEKETMILINAFYDGIYKANPTIKFSHKEKYNYLIPKRLIGTFQSVGNKRDKISAENERARNLQMTQCTDTDTKDPNQYTEINWLSKKNISYFKKELSLMGFDYVKTNDFLNSTAWKRIREIVLEKYGHACMCCGKLNNQEYL